MSLDRKRWLLLGLIVIGVLLIAATAFRPWKAAPEQAIVWLNPAQLNKAPGPLTRLKDRVKNLSAPLWQRFRRPRQQVTIDANFIELPSGVGEQAHLGPPTTTNSDGTLAWILSPSYLTEFQKFLRDTPEARLLSRPKVTTISGMQAGMFVGSATPRMGGLGMDVTATFVFHAIKLQMKAQSTEVAESAPGSGPTLRTNLSLACRVFLPNAGALVLQSRNPKEPNATNLWLILSPTAIDAAGNPIKL